MNIDEMTLDQVRDLAKRLAVALQTMVATGSDEPIWARLYVESEALVTEAERIGLIDGQE